jgi:hypothetical protein
MLDALTLDQLRTFVAVAEAVASAQVQSACRGSNRQ